MTRIRIFGSLNFVGAFDYPLIRSVWLSGLLLILIIFVTISVKGDTEFDRQLDNVYTTKKVNCLEMIVGTKIHILTLDGKQINLNIPPNTKNGTTFSMPGYGFPNLQSRQRGNMYIKIEAEIPRNLNNTQIEQIRGILNGS